MWTAARTQYCRKVSVHREQQEHRRNADTHPCSKRDSNPWSECSNGRKHFVPYTVRSKYLMRQNEGICIFKVKAKQALCLSTIKWRSIVSAMDVNYTLLHRTHCSVEERNILTHWIRASWTCRRNNFWSSRNRSHTFYCITSKSL